MIQRIGTAHDKIGDHDGQQDNRGECHNADDDGIACCTEQQVVDGRTIVIQRISALKHAHFRVAERNVDDVQLRKHRNSDDQIAEHVHHHAAKALRITFFNGMQCVHCEAEFFRRVLLQQENCCGQNNRDYADRCGEAIVRACLTQELFVDFNRERTVAFANQQRRTKISKRTHEDKKCCGQNRGHGQAKNHGQEPFYTAAAQICGRLHQAVIKI